ncbi:hypothetical protein Ancab_020740 [Ancistrocladus abbreviatus]
MGDLYFIHPLCLSRGIECSAGSIFGGFFNYLDTCNKAEVIDSGKASGCINNFYGNASQGLHLSGQNPYLSHRLNMLADKKLQPLVDINQEGDRVDYDVVGKCQPPAAGHDNTNHLLQETTMDSIFEQLQCQRASRVASPLLPSIYKRAAKDPAQILCELLNAPN